VPVPVSVRGGADAGGRTRLVRSARPIHPGEVIADALRRLLARWTAPREEWLPEVAAVDRQAAVAMTLCTCGHMWHLHEHPHVRTGCDACSCQRFRPLAPPETRALG